jgi:hypothetical protein
VSTQPYRELAVVKKIKKPTCGLLRPSKTIKPKPHACAPPGWLDRLFLVDTGTLWRCGTCGKVFEFVDASSVRSSNLYFGEWDYVNQEDWVRAGGEK